MSLFWILFQADCLSPVYLVVLLRFYLIPFSDISYCLTFCVLGLWSTSCRIAVLLASGVCSLVGEVVPRTCVGFLVTGTGACPLVGGAGSCPSGGQGSVKGCVLRWLWAQDYIRQLVCQWMGLCSHCVVCLVWGIPALKPAGCLLAPSVGTKIAAFLVHAEEYSLGASTTSVLVSMLGHSQPLPPQETLQDPQISLAQVLMESLLCPGSQCTRNFLCVLQEWNLCFPQSCGYPALKPF